jgi:hypothetical protein
MKNGVGKKRQTREREAALQYAHQVKARTNGFAKPINEGESVLITQAKARIASELSSVKSAYKVAYEAGDPDAVLDAQEKLSKLLSEQARVDNWTPPKQTGVSRCPCAAAP